MTNVTQLFSCILKRKNFNNNFACGRKIQSKSSTNQLKIKVKQYEKFDVIFIDIIGDKCLLTVSKWGKVQNDGVLFHTELLAGEFQVYPEKQQSSRTIFERALQKFSGKMSEIQ